MSSCDMTLRLRDTYIAHVAQLVEHHFGKVEVTGSIPVVGSNTGGLMNCPYLSTGVINEFHSMAGYKFLDILGTHWEPLLDEGLHALILFPEIRVHP